MARILGVPAVHPSHVGEVVMSTPMVPRLTWPTICVGETRICDADGVTLGRLSFEDGEGWISADVDMGATPHPRDPMPAGFWNSLLPISVHAVWHAGNVHGRIKYEAMKRLGLHRWKPGVDLPARVPAPAESAPEEKTPARSHNGSQAAG